MKKDSSLGFLNKLKEVGKKIKGFFSNLKNEFLLLSTAQKIVISAVSGILLVSIVGGIIVIAVFSGDSVPVESESPGSEDSEGITEPEMVPYDPDEFVIEQENPNILAETDPAGEDYLLNSMFIGDSNTVGFASNGFLPLENVVGIEGMGIQSVPSHRGVYYMGSDTAQTIPYAIAAQQPHRIFINFGTNNLVGVTTEQFIANYEKAIAAILEAWEYCDIIVTTIPPVTEQANNTNSNVSQKVVDQFNLALVDMVEANDWMLLNTTTLLKDEDGFLKAQYAASDGYHLVAAAHEAIIDFANTHVYETEDRRPQPLQAQPTRRNPPAPVVEEDDDESESTSSSTEPGIATAGEIERLKLAVSNGKKKLAESTPSPAGDGSDLAAAVIAASWVPQSVYDALNAAIASGEQLIASSSTAQATAVITAEATINSQISVYQQSKKTEATVSAELVAKQALQNSINTANTTLASATTTTVTDPAQLDKDKVFVNATYYTALQTAINEANAVVSNDGATVDQINAAKSTVDTAVNNYNTNKITGQKETVVPVNKDALNNAIAAANGTVGATVASADGATIPPGQFWATQVNIDAYKGIIAAAQAVYNNASATQAQVDAEVGKLTSASIAGRTEGTYVAPAPDPDPDPTPDPDTDTDPPAEGGGDAGDATA